MRKIIHNFNILSCNLSIINVSLILFLYLNYVRLQFVVKEYTFDLNVSVKRVALIANSSVDNQLIKILPGVNNSLTEFFNVSYPCLVACTFSSINLQLLLSVGFKRAAVLRPKIKMNEIRVFLVNRSTDSRTQ